MTVTTIARSESDDPIQRIQLEGGGLSAAVLSWGTALQSLYLRGHPHSLVLGFDDFTPYPTQSPYFGATVGRVANRIRDGKFTIDGKSYQVDRNIDGRHSLHGGADGIGKRNWRIADVTTNRVRLELRDPDGHMGFPGNCDIACTYELHGDGEFNVYFEASADQPTLCNLAHHSYFNLDGGDTILDHHLVIEADHYLPVDNEQMPTGVVAPVDATPFDFRQPRPIRYEEHGNQLPYDHNYCLSTVRKPTRHIATVHSPRSGITMNVATTEPGVQFYTGNSISTAARGLHGKPYQPFSGFCLEAQAWPDAPHHGHFPSIMLRPGELYRQHTQYRFRVGT